VDSQRKSLRRQFKDQEEFKRLKWALLKNPENLTPARQLQNSKKCRVFLATPKIKNWYY
jgi:transposase